MLWELIDRLFFKEVEDLHIKSVERISEENAEKYGLRSDYRGVALKLGDGSRFFISDYSFLKGERG